MKSKFNLFGGLLVIAMLASCGALGEILGVKSNEAPNITITTQATIIETTVNASEMASIKTKDDASLNPSVWTNLSPDIIEIIPAGAYALIKGKNVGTATVVVSHPQASDTLTIIVDVSAEKVSDQSSDGAKYLRADNTSYILAPNSSLTLSVELANGSEREEQSIIWTTKNPEIISLVGTSGSSIALTATANGTATVSASHLDSNNSLDYTIMVAEDGAASKYIVPIKTAYIIEEDQQITITTSFVGANSLERLNITWVSSDPTIAEVLGTGQIVDIIAGEKGTATITASHPRSANSPNIVIMVSEKSVNANDAKYIYAQAQTYTADIGDVITLSPKLYNGSVLEEMNFSWAVDNPAVIETIGTPGQTYTGKAVTSGTSVVTVSHTASANTYPMTIIVDEPERYLSFAQELLEVGRTSTDTSSLTLSIEGGVFEDANNITWSVSDPTLLTISGTGKTIIIHPLKNGTATIFATLDTTGQVAKTLVVIKDTVSGDGSAKYLRSSKTSHVIPLDVPLSLSAELANGTGLEQQEIAWDVADSNIVSLIGTSGGSITITASTLGTTTVTATHPSSSNSLDYTILVTNTGTESKYIVPSKTAYIIEEGERATISTSFVGASSLERLNIAWESNDPEIVQVIGSGQAVEVIASKEGTATITASHPHSANTPEITVVVTKGDASQTAKYITAKQQVVAGEVGDFIALSPQLENGTALDELNFTWEVDEPTILTPKGTPGETFTGEAIIAGTAVVTVSHSASVNTYDFTVTIAEPDAQYSLSRETITTETGNDPTILSIIAGYEFDYSEIVWSVSDPAIATIAGSGKNVAITPKAVGTINIYATLRTTGQVATALYIVNDGQDVVPQVKFLTASKTSMVANVDDSFSLRVRLANGTAYDDLNITWATSDDTVSLLGSQGNSITVNAIAAGNATIRASHPDSSNVLSFSILIKDDTNKYLIPDKNAYIIGEGESENVSVSFSGGTDLELLDIAWAVNNDSVARLVGTTGVEVQVLAVEAGNAEITVSHPQSANTIKISILVVPEETIEEETRYLTTSTQALLVDISKVTTLRARLKGGTDLDEQSIRWVSDDDSVISLSGDSGPTMKAEALKAGNAKITVSHPSSINSVDISVTVRSRTRVLSLSKNSVLLESSGDSKTITLFIDGGPQDDFNHVTWATNDPAVATVYGTGEIATVSPIGVGTAIITATLEITGQTANLLADVKPTHYIDMLTEYMKIEKGKSVEIEIAYGPSTLNPSIRSSDPTGVIVTQNDDEKKLTIRAIKEGVYSITASAPGGISDSLTIDSYVERGLTLENRTPIVLEPGATSVPRVFTVTPSDEAHLIEVSIVDPGVATLLSQQADNTFTVRSLYKEGATKLRIEDKRAGRTAKIEVDIYSEFQDISQFIHGAENIEREENWKQGANTDISDGTKFSQETINIVIDQEINVASFRWNTPLGYIVMGHESSGVYLVWAKNDEREAYVQFLGDGGHNWREGNDVEPMHGYLSFTIRHGVDGNKEYTGNIKLTCDPH